MHAASLVAQLYDDLGEPEKAERYRGWMIPYSESVEVTHNLTAGILRGSLDEAE